MSAQHQGQPAMISREDALLLAVRRFVDEKDAATRQEVGDRLHELEQVVISARDAQGDLSEALQRLSDAAAGPVDEARAMLRQIKAACEQADDAASTIRRWARSHLLSRARDLA
ncbi:hypothetical protein [Neoroseomonas rubea]|uniref:hypothetical protein n=1 Tax=Neoroseomonas rubea TaxID=2748666 RepID=UPI0018DFD3B0|nr:hypothetical protein [Roseomonas rubea]